MQTTAIMSSALVQLYRHKTWATLQLIEYCEGLADEDLDATIPGTYGTIRETLKHIVDAEEGYYSILTRQPFQTRAEAEAFVPSDPPPPDGPVSLAELAARIRLLGPKWEALATDGDLPGREVTSRDGYVFPGWVPMVQAIHHADDHRSHVMSILGARGLAIPEPDGLDVWGYAQSTGDMREMADD
jgi:uncharacterized damage-inducible protein DinB